MYTSELGKRNEELKFEITVSRLFGSIESVPDPFVYPIEGGRSETREREREKGTQLPLGKCRKRLFGTEAI